MSQPEIFNRSDPYRDDSQEPESLRTDIPAEADYRVSGGRPLGSPLPMGSAGRPLQEQSVRPAPRQGRSLPGSSNTHEEHAGQRAMSMLKQAMPFVQKLLPLIDGNVATAVANLFAARPHPPAQPPLDLTPVHNHITELQVQQDDLRTQVMEQNSSLKRVEDQLELVREATDRNTLEQQELIEDLKNVGNKVNLLAWLLFLMLLISVGLNLALFLHIKQVLP